MRICKRCKENQPLIYFKTTSNICLTCKYYVYFKTCSICKIKQNSGNFGKRLKTGFLRSDCNTCHNEYSRLYNKTNKDPLKKREYNKSYYHKKKIDINFKLKHNLRSRFYNAIKRNSKKGSVLTLIGCSIDNLKIYLSNQFHEGMTWDNYGSSWEIDHIKPLFLCDHANIEELKIYWNFNNLRPLFKSKNRQRSRSKTSINIII